MQEKKSKSTALSVVMFIFSVLLILSFCSFLIHWYQDLSLADSLRERHLKEKNLVGQLGVFLSYNCIYKGIGIAAFIPAFFLVTDSVKSFLGQKFSLNKWGEITCWSLFLSVFLGFLQGDGTVLSGAVGYEINSFFVDYTGEVGTYALLALLLLLYLIFKFDISKERVREIVNQVAQYIKKPYQGIGKLKSIFAGAVEKKEKVGDKTEIKKQKEEQTREEVGLSSKETKKTENDKSPIEIKVVNEDYFKGKDEGEDETDSQESKKTSEELVEKYGEYDPKLEFSGYKYPDLSVFNKSEEVQLMDKDELNENQEKIIRTLKNFGVEIKSISATIGPTVTLYEIVPTDGVKISKVRGLEDDIALSLAALGIRIIAPIPGKGTVGIEIPNKKTSLVSMRSVISSNKFQNSKMILPIAFGKTITNETFVVDLAKMPHLLMAGATGQGKSVGLNVILTSLLYKKHPSEVKFVLVDPKKVELSLYRRIERYYLAKLPDEDSAIITDNSKVINTLNSLCIEMDNRYELLKSASTKNIEEYNNKFIHRELNPEKGHKFLPYIVLIVDEFADLIMTAGKEIEMPIARLAQLARAVGIHLIIATQRPTVNVITGLIKANFPARIAFKVSQKIDSKTILDGSGADKLIGKGDMLYTQGNELIRIQCAFVDTPEVERLVDVIDKNICHSSPYVLPEAQGEGGIPSQEVDMDKRDSKFIEAAEIVVTAQKGSVSDIQRKLELGFNRAGRIMDQLEAAGIVGPNRGSKPRDVFIQDIYELEEYLSLKGYK